MAGSKPPRVTAVAVAVITVAGGAGCAGRADGAGTGPAGRAARTPKGITAAQLEGALLTRIPGFTPFGRPESGAYGSLRSVRQGGQLQQAANLDKPHCAKATQGFGADPRVREAPAASVAFAKALQLTVHEMLVAVPADVADAQVGYRVPESCRSYKARIGDGRWFSYRVVESGDPAAGALGDASRTVGVAASSTSGSRTSRTRIWHVAFRRGGYVGSVTLSGPQAGRADAEELARRAYEEAERALP